MKSGTSIEPFLPSDWESVRSIYADGIADGQATFETAVPTWEQWDSATLKFCRLVAKHDGQVIGWATLKPVSTRECYSGVAEVTIYVAAEWRGHGVGKLLLEHLILESEKNGIWTLQGSTFPENVASIRLQQSCGFRIVGRREKVAQQNGVWRDTVLTERRSRVAGTE